MWAMKTVACLFWAIVYTVFRTLFAPELIGTQKSRNGARRKLIRDVSPAGCVYRHDNGSPAAAAVVTMTSIRRHGISARSWRRCWSLSGEYCVGPRDDTSLLRSPCSSSVVCGLSILPSTSTSCTSNYLFPFLPTSTWLLPDVYVYLPLWSFYDFASKKSAFVHLLLSVLLPLSLPLPLVLVIRSAVYSISLYSYPSFCSYFYF